jgi:ABC-type multidrug transport system fused ATPase/permease subunit
LLFNISIKDNILYGNEGASDERVYEVAKLANALQFIENLDEDD